ncbi:hypothetical protein ACP70R_041776 [Stipagrostis hirtigluma subsp. patula]
MAAVALVLMGSVQEQHSRRSSSVPPPAVAAAAAALALICSAQEQKLQHSRRSSSAPLSAATAVVATLVLGDGAHKGSGGGGTQEWEVAFATLVLDGDGRGVHRRPREENYDDEMRPKNQGRERKK